MHGNHDPRRQLIFGVFLTVFGGLLLLDRLDIMEFSDVFRYFWPLILIWLGVSKLMRGNRRWKLDAEDQNRMGEQR